MQLPQQRQNSFFKGLLTFYLIFLAVFFAAAPFLTLLLYAETDLSLSLLPQLIGFCLQGAFLVVVFSVYEKRSSLNSKRSHKFALRTFISDFVNPCMDKDLHEEGLISSPAMFADGLEKLRNQGMEEQTVEELKQVAQQNITSMESLTVLAAQIDHVHLEIWGAILHESRNVRDSSSQQETESAVIKLLENINRFDELVIF
jgi:hypothetical protein